MLIKAKTLTDYSLQNTNDETIGKAKEFYFDDRHWTVRYLIVNTGNWLTGRQVLISPYAIAAVNIDHQNFVVDLTKKQIEGCPSLDTDKPVSRQYETEYYGYYGLPMYWGGPYSWGSYAYLERDHKRWNKAAKVEKAWDSHLRSTQEVSGYNIHASDGVIGHVVDFVIDDETWAIRYLIIDTQNWWPGKKVLISPQWIDLVSWGERKVFTKLSRESIKQSPEYTEEALLTREFENALHNHYQLPGYWADEPAEKVHNH
jgi:sporulation protein YlmC with PRC-barrel domain